ncbi:MAG: Asp-tRNA(Asn)/Glu-tRNA(Gln) amidotransferase subunit GatA [Acidobacteria bacterium]|nr:Asp-tRNA(Asn)/Glu-tRNA(Gln) amidotransferase subunit GatA [Acidobacteriota bacterium]MCG3192888.1 Glutamyl-tRNA(Gln) amidotransferase subunit A [Thermoanaerobaculia bacterium]
MPEATLLLDGSGLELARRVSQGEISAVEVAKAALARAEEARRRHGSFLFLDPDVTLRQASTVDQRLSAGEKLPLAGVPLAVKDNINVAGLPSTAGSRILEGFTSVEDATCVARLVSAGAVVVGKANCDEFGMGSSNENSAWGPVKNPWDESRVPGGSSGGSAAAVAAFSVPLAIGTDTGGSVRQPAALCGLVGWKPTYGRVSRYGLIAFASSLDQAGALARSVTEAAVAFSVMAGADPRDSTSLPTPAPDVLGSLGDGIAGLRVGLLAEAESAEGGLDPDVKVSLERTAEALRQAGASVRTVSLPRVNLAIDVYYLTATAEASSNLARFDGVRYGRRVEGEDLGDLYRRSRSSGFGPEVKRRILLGTFALSAGYHDAYYGRAQKVRALLKRDFDRAFGEVDAILCPTSPEPAFEFGSKTEDPLAMYLADVFTVSPSLAGIPAISVPSGLSSRGLPIGMQFIGPADSEPVLFRLARAVEEWSGFPAFKAAGAIR